VVADEPELPDVLKSPSGKEILASGTELVSIREGTPLITNFRGQDDIITGRPIIARTYRMIDPKGYRWVLNKEGHIKWMVEDRLVHSIQQVTELYRPPHSYTPAPTNIPRREYDRQFKWRPEARFSAGLVRADFVRDLFNQRSSVRGQSTHYAASVFTDWDLPIKVGAGVNYELSQYQLSTGTQARYSSLSAGPIFRSRDIDWSWPTRFQLQLRVSPFSALTSESAQGSIRVRFNSADLTAGVENLFKNYFGEFTMGLFFNLQWLNLQNQQFPVNLNSTQQSNKSVGISLAQVF
jgi:hypothetical protein